MFLFKRSNGYYYLYFRSAHGKWTCVSTRTKLKPEANRFLTEFRKHLRQKKTAPILSEFISQYLAYSRVNHAVGTTQRAGYALDRFRDYIQGERYLDRITPQDIEGFKSRRLEDGVSPVTVNIELRTLRACFALAVDWDLIEDSPFRKSKLIRIPESSPPFFSRQDFNTLVQHITKRWLRDITVFDVHTGLRRGELINLKWEHVDFVGRLVKIRNTGEFVTKSRHERNVPLNPTALNVLKELPRLSEYVFTTPDGRKINPKRLSEHFSAAVKAAGLNSKLHFHSLRHTFATWLLQSGVPIFEVQRLLGHSNIQVTMGYSHLQAEELHATVNRLSNEVGEKDLPSAIEALKAILARTTQ